MTSQKTSLYSRRKDVGRISMPKVADIFEAADIHAAALRAIQDANAATVVVDCSGMDRMDVSSVQTLFAVKTALAGIGRRFELRGLSETQARTWSRIGCCL